MVRRIKTTFHLSGKHSREKKKCLYDRQAEVHVFSPGDEVLAILLVMGSHFQGLILLFGKFQMEVHTVVPNKCAKTLFCLFH